MFHQYSIKTKKSHKNTIKSFVLIQIFLDPKNKSIEPILIRLHKHVQARIDEMSTTKSKTEKMVNIGIESFCIVIIF